MALGTTKPQDFARKPGTLFLCLWISPSTYGIDRTNFYYSTNFVTQTRSATQLWGTCFGECI